MFHVKHYANNMITGAGLIQVFGINGQSSHLSIEVHGGGVWASGGLALGLFIGQAPGVLYPSVLAGMLIGLAIWLLGIEPQYFCLRGLSSKAFY